MLHDIAEKSYRQTTSSGHAWLCQDYETHQSCFMQSRRLVGSRPLLLSALIQSSRAQSVRLRQKDLGGVRLVLKTCSRRSMSASLQNSPSSLLKGWDKILLSESLEVEVYFVRHISLLLLYSWLGSSHVVLLSLNHGTSVYKCSAMKSWQLRFNVPNQHRLTRKQCSCRLIWITGVQVFIFLSG